jgi:hypothetical protein
LREEQLSGAHVRTTPVACHSDERLVLDGGSALGPRDESAKSPTPDFALLQDQLSKLAALVDHYYAAYRETRGLLERRERELANLRRKLNTQLAPLHR